MVLLSDRMIFISLYLPVREKSVIYSRFEISFLRTADPSSSLMTVRFRAPVAVDRNQHVLTVTESGYGDTGK